MSSLRTHPPLVCACGAPYPILLQGITFEIRVFEFGLISKRGNKIPVLFSESMLINNENEVVGQVVVATDITKRKEADKKIRDSLKEKDVLLSEIHHRVKNNLAVISGILQLQGYKTKNKKVIQALSESQARIQSMSIVHEMLYQSDSLALYCNTNCWHW